MVVVWQVRCVGTPWPAGPWCMCCIASLCRAINLHFHKLRAFCVHASHHMWIYFFPFWEIPERNVVEILQKSTSAGWKEASSVTDRMANLLHPCRCTYTSERVCAPVQAHPVPCRARNIAALHSWALDVGTLKNLCPGGLIAFPTASSKLCCVSCTFSVFTDMESQKVVRSQRDKTLFSNGTWNFILQSRVTACVLDTPLQNILWKTELPFFYYCYF